jgi:hypothetical protein
LILTVNIRLGAGVAREKEHGHRPSHPVDHAPMLPHSSGWPEAAPTAWASGVVLFSG